MSNIESQKRWRGNLKNTYWFIDPRGNIDFTLELFLTEDDDSANVIPVFSGFAVNKEKAGVWIDVI